MNDNTQAPPPSDYEYDYEVYENDTSLDVSPEAIVERVQRRKLAMMLGKHVPDKDELALYNSLTTVAQKQQTISIQATSADNTSEIIGNLLSHIHSQPKNENVGEPDDYIRSKRVITLPETEEVPGELEYDVPPIEYEDIVPDD